jgi:APA family basic amino acid/polyamine antiporter
MANSFDAKKISFGAAVLMNINIIVGGGIYLYPQLMAQQAGNLSFLGWLLAGLLLLPVALTIAQAARIFPGEGGFYNYCTTALGEDAGFIANWAYLLGYMGTAATLTSAVRDKLIDPVGITFIKDYPIVFYFAFVLFLALLNMVNIKLISRIQSTITLLKLIPLMLMLGLVYLYWNPSFDYQLGRISDLGGTLPLALFGFFGFESCCNISHHIRGGTKQAFKVVLIAFSASVLLYTIFHLGILHIMGGSALATQGVHAFPNFMGFSAATASILATLLLIDMLLSFSNTAYGASLNNITNLNLLARQGLLFKSKFLAKLNTQNMPAHAALVYAAFTIALIVFVPNTITLTAITNIGVCSTLLLTLISVLVQSWNKKSYGSLVIAVFAILSVATLLYLTWMTKLGNTHLTRLLYATPIFIGIPIGYAMYRWAKKIN